ncbi:ABC transporter ATP-binding protein [Nocardioides limicola]|uniref:ABC transporter ATP-binding protein n=1 Tax=Nocardioides limicola TaxID=2803368 RepID=UPI00193AED81|nr:ABC transporter ATP-binding protein [Nocardioides sp. DJM-14]
MIEFRDVSVTFDGNPALTGVDLSLAEGELGLVAGRTGAGKSTLLGVVTGAVPRFTGGELRGDLLVDGVSVIELPPRERAHLIGAVAQDPAAGFVTDSVEEELAYGMEQLGLTQATMRRRVEETLDLLGIADLRHRELRTLSGGEQQRVAIGSVLTMHPQVLVLDEPTSALDPTAAEDVLATLSRLVHDLGLTVLLAEHRLERVIPFADRICLVADGRVRIGEPAAMLADAPIAPPIVELGRALGWSPLPLTVRDARRLARQTPLGVDKAQLGADRARLGADRAQLGADKAQLGVVVARGVSVAHGTRTVLSDVDLTLAAGEVTALMGRNGSGKSTLLWTLQGGRARRSGTVSTPAGDPARMATAERRRTVALVPQTAADLLYLETVAAECEAADEGNDTSAGRCRSILDSLVPGIPGDRHPRDLSEGQRLALALAVVLTSDPDALLLDEPTRGLDYPGKRALGSHLSRLAADGLAVLVASHDVEFVAQVADRVLVLADGEVVSAGPVRDVVAESPSFAPQVTKILGPPWLTVDEVVAARERA